MADREQGITSPETSATSVIEKRIFVIRERQVMLDEDLADLYGVETKRLIEQVKRNLERFPEDFMFQLRKDEAAALRSQIATSNVGRGGRRYAPYVFTEQGVAMLSSVLRGKTAIAVNIEIMRAFVELRRVASSYAAIEKRLEQIERGMGEHDEQLEQIFGALRQLIVPPPQQNRPIGFRIRDDDEAPKPRSAA
ncbi:MAG TPA: ORF6N domain-containing protein [Solirubrobacterales bacterium]